MLFAGRKIVVGAIGQALEVSGPEIGYLGAKFSRVALVKDVVICNVKSHEEANIFTPNILKFRSSIITNPGPLSLLWPKQSSDDKSRFFARSYGVNSIKSVWPRAVKRENHIFGGRIAAILDPKKKTAHNLIVEHNCGLPPALVKPRKNKGPFPGSQCVVGFIKCLPLEKSEYTSGEERHYCPKRHLFILTVGSLRCFSIGLYLSY